MSPVSPLIHIVDDDAAVREALGLLVGTVGLRVAQWPHPQEFLDRFEREAVGAIVLDMRMPGLSGLTVLDRLRAAGVDQPVIVLTGHGTVEMCRRAFKSGAAEFLEKPVADELLLEAVHNAVRAHVLSRQRDAAGLTNKEIGRALAVSPRTVETHRAHLSDKLQVASLAQLIRQYATLVDAAAPP
jgi:two-component system, LuxR family, response regulator FixJ